MGFACPGDPVDVTVDGTRVCLGERLRPLRALVGSGGLLVTTLFHSGRQDAGLRAIWEWHYRTRHGANGCVLYDHAGKASDPGEAPDAIPWVLPYMTDGVHCAQSLQLVHAALACHLYAPPKTWLLNVDFDEFLWSVVPLRTITATLSATSHYDAVGARCMWADADDVEAAVRAGGDDQRSGGDDQGSGGDGQNLRVSPFTFAWPQRAKYAQRHDSLQTIHRGIHAPAPGARVLPMTPEEGRLVHFAYASGAARSEHILLLPSSKKFFCA